MTEQKNQYEELKSDIAKLKRGNWWRSFARLGVELVGAAALIWGLVLPSISNTVDSEVSEWSASMEINSRLDTSITSATKSLSLAEANQARFADYAIRFDNYQKRIRELEHLSRARENKVTMLYNREAITLQNVLKQLAQTRGSYLRVENLITRIALLAGVNNVERPKSDEEMVKILRAVEEEFKKSYELIKKETAITRESVKGKQ